MKRLLLIGALVGALLAPASAQVNVVPQVGTITATLNKLTYRAVSIGLVPPASATDIFCITGSASRTIKVTGFTVQGIATTAITAPVVVLRRASVDTGGTAASTIANPANTIGKSDTQNSAATATLIAYTANPTIVDTSPTYLAASHVSLPLTTGNASALSLTFGSNLPQFTQQVVLRGIADQVCLNLQAATVLGGSLNITASWTEE